MWAAWKVTTPEEGEKRLEQLARFLERDYESAARGLREGMAEMFTLQRLKLPPSLYKYLATTNQIESPQKGVARRTANVKYRLDQGMVERWVASTWLLAENRFRKICGHRGRWPRFPDAKPRLKSRRRKERNMKVPSSVFQSLHGISWALDNHSIRCFANTGIDFSIREV
jgi:hypothetical protein